MEKIKQIENESKSQDEIELSELDRMIDVFSFYRRIRVDYPKSMLSTFVFVLSVEFVFVGLLLLFGLFVLVIVLVVVVRFILSVSAVLIFVSGACCPAAGIVPGRYGNRDSVIS